MAAMMVLDLRHGKILVFYLGSKNTCFLFEQQIVCTSLIKQYFLMSNDCPCDD